MVILAMIPPALIARLRATYRDVPRVHLMQDMGVQHRFGAQSANPMFADGRGMRPQVEGTVARGDLMDDPHYYQGMAETDEGPGPAESFPQQIQVNRALIERGQERFNIYCQLCHGYAGYGDGIVNQRAMMLQSAGTNQTTWVSATNLHEPQIIEMPVGQLFQTITYGVRNMPPYGHLIPVADRWAIVAYIKALQRSQSAEVEILGPVGLEDETNQQGEEQAQ